MRHLTECELSKLNYYNAFMNNFGNRVIVGKENGFFIIHSKEVPLVQGKYANSAGVKFSTKSIIELHGFMQGAIVGKCNTL